MAELVAEFRRPAGRHDQVDDILLNRCRDPHLLDSGAGCEDVVLGNHVQRIALPALLRLQQAHYLKFRPACG